MEQIKKVALSVLAAMAAVCMATALLLWSLPMLRAVAAETTASTAEELQQQIDSADVGDTVKLGADISADIEVPKGKEITLDLNGFTLTNESDHTIMNYGALTIVDNSAEGTGTVDNVTHARGALFNFGEATLLGGTYTRSLENGSSSTESGGNSWYVIKNLGHLTIGEENAECDVAVTQSGHFSSMITNGYYNADGSGDHLQYYTSVTTEDHIPTLLINGGTFSGGINTVKNDNHSVTVINGGEFTNVSQAVVLNWNDLTITGGEFVAGEGAQAAIITSYDDTGFNDGTTTITGGTFEGAVTADYNADDVTYSVSGGTFSEALSADYIAEDAVLYQQENGGYAVADSETAAENGVVVVMDGVGYASLEEAVAEGCKVIIEREGQAISEGFANVNSSQFVDTAFTAALEAVKEGDVLRLVDDYKGVLSIDMLDRSITVDLNGHNWSASSGTVVVYVTTSADFTLTNSGEEGGIKANMPAINIKAASGADIDVSIENVNVSSSWAASTLIALTGTDGMMRVDLNGLDVEYTVTNEKQAMALSVTDADLTMTDSNISIAYGSETPGSATTTAIDLNHANAELTRVTATSEDGAGIVFTGSMSFDEAVAASVSEYAHLTLNGCTVSGSTIALSGNGGENLSGTLIDVQNSTLTSTGNAGLAVYHPQYGVLNILGTGNTLTGVTGIEIRAGELNVEGGTITATGAFASNPSGGGSTTDGVAIAVTQHTTALPIDVTISGGTLNATGAEGKSLYQANVQGNDPTDVAKIEMQVTGGTFNAAVESENVTEFISGGTFDETLFGDYIADGLLQCPAEDGYIVGDPDIVAEGKDVFVIGNTAYDTLQAAVDAVPADNTQTTITFVDGTGDKKLSGNGVKVQANQNIVFDYNGNIYDIDGTTVGSAGTETNGFQLLKGATVVMQNGTLTSDKAIILIQKYCDLTLDDMLLDGTNTNQYVLSNNNATTIITGDTQIIAADGSFAFDVCYWDAYDAVKVVFDDAFTGSITGGVEYGTYSYTGTVQEWYQNTSIEVNGNGRFDITIEVQNYDGADAAEANINIAGGTFVNPVAGEYIADGFMIYQREDGSYTVADDETAAEDGVVIVMNGVGYTSIDAAVEAGCVATIVGEQIHEGYETLEEALLAAEAGDTITLHADITTVATITIGKAVTLDLNGHDVIGGSANGNFVMNIAAGGVTITNSAEEESIVQTGSAEIGALAIRSGLTEEVKIENITILIDDNRTSESGNIVGIQLQSPTLIDNVKIDISASYPMVLGILAADGEATISNSTFTVRSKEGSDAEVHAIHAQDGADIALIDSAITATGNGTGVVFIGEYANGEEAISAGSSVFPTLTITDSTIVSDSFALAGNGASHGTVIEINSSTLTSELAAAIYHPQYGEMTIVNSNITGTSGIEVRAGIVTVTSGNITATGDPFASDPNGNGSTTDGAAIALVQHTTALPTQVTVTGGTLNGIRAFYQANLQGNDAAALEKIAINLQGGTYNGEVYSENKTGYITGGQYLELPAEDAFLEGYAGELFNGYYVVVESGEAGDTADLLAMRLEAQADVRLYAAALGLNWTEVSGDVEISSAYAAINTATSESIIALAKTQAMDAIDQYYAKLIEMRADAIAEIEQAAGSDVTVPTATYAAINGAMSEKEINDYKENALDEIKAIRSLRTEIEAQTSELESISSAIEKLESAFTGEGSEFGSLLGDIRELIDAAQEEILSGTSESLEALQTAIEAKIEESSKAAQDAVASVQKELESLAGTVAANDAALKEAIAASEEALGAQIGAAQTDIESVQADIEELNTSIAAVQADIDAILASLPEGDVSMADIAEQIAAVKTTVDGLNGSVGDVQAAVEAAQNALAGQIEEADDAAAFTALYVLVGIALALSAVAVVLLVVLLFKRPKVVTVSGGDDEQN